MELYDLGGFGGLMFYHSVTQWKAYDQHKTHQFIAQSDNDNVFKNPHKPQGTNDTTTLDIIK